MNAFEDILYSVDGHVATITLNRPDVLNSISLGLENEFHAALDLADADDQVRVIILTGAGRSFSAGYDMSGTPTKPYGTLDPTGDEIGDYLAYWYSFDSGTTEKLLHLWRLKKPVIAAVHGYVMGGGFWYATAADITIAADTAVFGQPEVRHISNTTFLFVALCGWKVANRFALTGDHMDAAEALRVGLINEVVPETDMLTRARALAERIAMVPPHSVRMNKAIAMRGLMAAGVAAGLELNGALSTLGHTSHGPERQALFDAMEANGMRGYLDARDGRFLPEPFGPKSRPRS